jgi:hypothetical protein
MGAEHDDKRLGSRRLDLSQRFLRPKAPQWVSPKTFEKRRSLTRRGGFARPASIAPAGIQPQPLPRRTLRDRPRPRRARSPRRAEDPESHLSLPETLSG